MFQFKKMHLSLLISVLTILIALGITIPGSVRLFAATNTTLSVDVTSNDGTINPFAWGVNAPDKYMTWAGNPTVTQRIHDAGIKLVRVGPIQYSIYRGTPMCSSPTACDFTNMDAALKTIFDAGAEPLFVIAGYPGGIAEHDWNNYAIFMKQVVNRYNVQLVLGHKVRYWEMWNEPENEPDGKIPDRADWANFVKTVGSAMKGIDSSIRLVGPAAPWADLGQDGYVDYAAKNTNDLLDILSWHDYGKHEETDDQKRLTDTSRYFSEVQQAQAIQSSTGKHFGAALTEYNMAWGNLASGNNQYYHTNYNAVYAASTIIAGIKSKADMFDFYALSQAGENYLGLLDNTSFAPFTPYYALSLFGNHTGTTLLKSSGGNSLLDIVASRSADGNKIFVTVVNRDMQNAQNATIALNSGLSGSYTSYTLDGNTLPLTGQIGTYTGGQFTTTLAPLSVVSFEITPNCSQAVQTSTPIPPASDVKFSFESGTSGWQPNGSISAVESSVAVAKDGTRSLCVAFNSANQSDFPYTYTDSLPAPLSGGQTVTAYIYVAKGSNVEATLFVMDQNWSWYGGTFTKLSSGSWNRLNYTLPTTMSGSVRTLGIQLYGNQATVYIDALSWN